MTATVVRLDMWRARRNGPPLTARERTLLDQMPPDVQVSALRVRAAMWAAVDAGDDATLNAIEAALAKAAGDEFACCDTGRSCVHRRGVAAELAARRRRAVR